MSSRGGSLAAIGLLAALCACSHDYVDPALDVPGEAQPLVFALAVSPRRAVLSYSIA